MFFSLMKRALELAQDRHTPKLRGIGTVMEYHRSAPISYFNLPLFLYYFPPSSEFQCFAYISGLTCPKAVILWYLCYPLPCLYFVFDHVMQLLHVTVTDFPACDWLCTVSSLLSSLHHILMAGTACHCLLMVDTACHHLLMAYSLFWFYTASLMSVYILADATLL